MQRGGEMRGDVGVRQKGEEDYANEDKDGKSGAIDTVG